MRITRHPPIIDQHIHERLHLRRRVLDHVDKPLRHVSTTAPVRERIACAKRDGVGAGVSSNGLPAHFCGEGVACVTVGCGQDQDGGGVVGHNVTPDVLAASHVSVSVISPADAALPTTIIP